MGRASRFARARSSARQTLHTKTIIRCSSHSKAYQREATNSHFQFVFCIDLGRIPFVLCIALGHSKRGASAESQEADNWILYRFGNRSRSSGPGRDRNGDVQPTSFRKRTTQISCSGTLLAPILQWRREMCWRGCEKTFLQPDQPIDAPPFRKNGRVSKTNAGQTVGLRVSSVRLSVFNRLPEDTPSRTQRR